MHRLGFKCSGLKKTNFAYLKNQNKLKHTMKLEMNNKRYEMKKTVTCFKY